MTVVIMLDGTKVARWNIRFPLQKALFGQDGPAVEISRRLRPLVRPGKKKVELTPVASATCEKVTVLQGSETGVGNGQQPRKETRTCAGQQAPVSKERVDGHVPSGKEEVASTNTVTQSTEEDYVQKTNMIADLKQQIQLLKRASAGMSPNAEPIGSPPPVGRRNAARQSLVMKSKGKYSTAVLFADFK